MLTERACWKSSKSGQEQRIDLQPFQIVKTMTSALYFKLGIGNPVESLHSNFIGLSRSCKNHLFYKPLETEPFSRETPQWTLRRLSVISLNSDLLITQHKWLWCNKCTCIPMSFDPALLSSNSFRNSKSHKRLILKVDQLLRHLITATKLKLV